MEAPSAETPAEQAKRALERALREVRNDADAEALIAQLYRQAASRTVDVIPVRNDADRARRAAAIARAVQSVRDQPNAAPQLFTAAAEQLAAAMPTEGSPVDEGVLRATNPGPAVGEGQPELDPNRRRLRRALVKRLKPMQAVDTSLFLDINQLPHPRWMNAAMRVLTIVMKRADAMVVGLLLAAVWHPKRGARAVAEVVPSLWLSTFIVETPVKIFFRRKRPFIDIVRATVVGRRPSSFSFPSGHSAARIRGSDLAAPPLSALDRRVLSAGGGGGVFTRLLGRALPGRRGDGRHRRDGFGGDDTRFAATARARLGSKDLSGAPRGALVVALTPGSFLAPGRNMSPALYPSAREHRSLCDCPGGDSGVCLVLSDDPFVPH